MVCNRLRRGRLWQHLQQMTHIKKQLPLVALSPWARNVAQHKATPATERAKSTKVSTNGRNFLPLHATCTWLVKSWLFSGVFLRFPWKCSWLPGGRADCVVSTAVTMLAMSDGCLTFFFIWLVRRKLWHKLCSIQMTSAFRCQLPLPLTAFPAWLYYVFYKRV